MNRHNLSYPAAPGAALACLLLVLAAAGCSRVPDLDTEYGKTFGTPGQKSVNGTSVLVDMFEAAGSDVTTVARFSPRLERADVIVWFPDDFEPPSQKHREYLEEWLQAVPGRTVVYVGRDYDAAADYWRAATPLAEPEQAAEYHRKLAEAMSDWNTERMKIPADTYARWFKTKVAAQRPVITLEGPWAEGIDPQKADIKLATRFDLPVESDRPAGDYQPLPDFEVLLSSQQEPLVTRVSSPGWYGGQVLVVTNGSFLLNFPLVNKAHRKLAGRLIDETGGGNVVFVESEQGGPPIRKREEDPAPRTGFDMLTVWPLNVILLHSLGWLLLVCICLYPIFGRPRKVYGAKSYGIRRQSSPLAHLLLSVPPEEGDDAPAASGDFGRHLSSLGEMLLLTGNREFAEEKLRYYHQHVKRDSGASHVPAARTPKPTTTNLL